MINHLDATRTSPIHEGFRMPAEWETHRRTWMCWPSRAACFGTPEQLLRAKQAYARVARAISAFEPVIMAVRPEEMAEAKLATGGKVDVVEFPLDDGWARDFGPTFVKTPKRQLFGVRWRFNAWGEKYHSYDNDSHFAARVLAYADVPLHEAQLTCEGGAICADGAGTVLTTEQCLLNPNRNPTLSKADVEARLRECLGAHAIVWLGSGFSDDETDGHVDNIACFAAKGEVLLGLPASRSHPDYAATYEALHRLQMARDADGKRLEIIEMPQPRKVRQAWNGKPLPASYINFYLCNGAVIMPAFDDPNDDGARAVIADCFPGRDIMQIEALDIVQGGGGIHCITQQEPAA